MLDAMGRVVLGGTEVALIIALLGAVLGEREQQQTRRGLLLAIAVAVVLLLAVQTARGREVTELVMGLMVVLQGLVFMLYLLRRGAEGTLQIRWLVLAGTAILVLPPVLQLARLLPRIWAIIGSRFSSELLFQWGAVLVGVGLAVLLGVALARVSAGIAFRVRLVLILMVLAVLIGRHAVIALQVLLSTGVIPLTRTTLAIMLPLVNNLAWFDYSLLGVGAVVVLVGWFSRPAVPVMAPNPAQRRLLRAGNRQRLSWLGWASALIVMAPLIIGFQVAAARRTVELSPAVPVQAIDGAVSLDLVSLKDGALHRFAYQAQDGTEVRFLVIAKSDTALGVALDACQICGPAGYYQWDNQVVCANCRVVINKPTIGLTGGCNPIPLNHTYQQQMLVVQAVELEQAAGRFKR